MPCTVKIISTRKTCNFRVILKFENHDQYQTDTRDGVSVIPSITRINKVFPKKKRINKVKTTMFCLKRTREDSPEDASLDLSI